MKKKILLLYSYTNQKHLINSIVNHVSSTDLKLVAFDVNDWTYNDDSKMPLIFRILTKLKGYKLFSFLGYKLIQYYLRTIVAGYDAIDINAFMPTHYRILDYIIKIKKPYKISFWGSDLYRANDEEMSIKSYYLQIAKIIQVETPSVKKDLLNRVPSVESKIEIANYGIDMLDIIDKERNHSSLIQKEIINNRIVITCGYNASEGQQHKIILKALNSLPANIKERIYLFLPMTYGSPSTNYINEIDKQAANTGIDYKIFTDRLTDVELAHLRLLTDIVLNIQITDSFASSLIEHLYSGNLLIVGEWLPYDVFSDNGIYYIKTRTDSINDSICFAIENLPKIKQITSKNIDLIRYMSSWEYVKNKHRKIYYKLTTD